MLAAADFASHQSRLFQHTEVLGDRVQRNIEWRSEVGDPGFAASEQGDDRAARRVGDGRERLIERCRIFNHLVEYSYDDLTRSSRLSLAHDTMLPNPRLAHLRSPSTD